MIDKSKVVLHQKEDGSLQLRDEISFLWCACGAPAVHHSEDNLPPFDYMCVMCHLKQVAPTLVPTQQRIEELEKANRAMQAALESVIRNDKTKYGHHDKRPFDGKTPREVSGGTIWLTPKEIAYDTLESLGIRPPYGTD